LPYYTGQQQARAGFCCDIAGAGSWVSWTPCLCEPAREAAGRGRGVGHVRVACTSCHDQLRQTVFFEPPHDRGHRPLTGWVTGPDP
jgi:hypothetical protein